jgi:RimJ/RimL family protein N-acetyltransferase
VDPALRRRGYATAMINAVLAMPKLAHVALFGAGVEPANAASVRCLLKAGFAPLDPAPDREGIVYYARRARHRHAEPAVR